MVVPLAWTPSRPFIRRRTCRWSASSSKSWIWAVPQLEVTSVNVGRLTGVSQNLSYLSLLQQGTASPPRGNTNSVALRRSSTGLADQAWLSSFHSNTLHFSLIVFLVNHQNWKACVLRGTGR